MLFLSLGAMLGAWIGLATSRKIPVTPLLAIHEKNPTRWDDKEYQLLLEHNFGFVFGNILRGFAGRSNFILCEEGIVTQRFIRPILFRWKRFNSYIFNSDSSEFKLKFPKKRMGELIITSKQKFDEVNRIL